MRLFVICTLAITTLMACSDHNNTPSNPPDIIPEDDMVSAMDSGRTDLGRAPDMPSQTSAMDMAAGEDMAADEDMAAGEDMPRGCDGACEYAAVESFSDIKELEGISIPSNLDNRDLPILIRYPADASGPLPVIVWAHAGSWSSTGHKSHRRWSTLLARAGYAVVHFAVVQPNEAHLATLCDRFGVTDPNICDDRSITGPPPEDPDNFINPFHSITVVRPADGAVVVKALPMLSARLEEEANVSLDASKTIVAGWSGGAQVSLQMAGATRILAEGVPPHSDPDDRPIAFVGLSPQGPGFSNFFANDDGSTSWDAITRPTMIMTGVGDEKPKNDLTGPDRRAVFTHMPPGGKILFYSTDPADAIAHSSFNLDGFDSDDPATKRLSVALASAMLAFCDAHARDHQPAKDWLASDAAVSLTEGNLDWELK